MNSRLTFRKWEVGTPADSIDTRIMTGVWRNGSAWFAHGVTDPAIGDNENVARWYQVATNDFPTNAPTLVQSGNIDPGPDRYAWMPAIAVDDNDNMGIGFAIGGPNEYLGAAFTGRLNTDPLGFTSTSIQTYTRQVSATMTIHRAMAGTDGGITAALAIDPADDTTFWAFHEFATAGNTWATQFGSFQLDPVPDSDWFCH